MKFISTFRFAGAELSFLHEEKDIYTYVDRVIALITEGEDNNPIINLCKFMFGFFLSDYKAGKPFSFITAKSAASIRDAAHRLTFWVNFRSLKVKVEDIVIEDKVPVSVPTFEGDFLSFNTAIEQYYDKPKKGTR